MSTNKFPLIFAGPFSANIVRIPLLCIGLGALAACGGGSSHLAPSTYSVGGTVTGLSGSVVLDDNGGDALTVTASGTFTFATKLANSAAYAVTVATQPTGQTCTVTGGSGTISGADVTGVSVTCATSSYTVGGTVSGLAAGASVVLQDNGGNALTVSSNTTFVFSTPIDSGSPYAVTVLTQPTGQTCTVTGGSGTVASANVTSVAVACATKAAATYTVGGTVTGLSSGTLVLQDNGGDALNVKASGPFVFAKSLATDAAYAVTVATQPSGATCTVASGTGKVGTADITSVTVTCVAGMSVGGTVSGLAANSSVVLSDNGDSLTVKANGNFSFPKQATTGAAYSVSVSAQPSGQNCAVTNGAGTVATASVTNIAISCAKASPPPTTGTPTATFTTAKSDATNLSSLVLPSANALVQASSAGGIPIGVLITPPNGTTETVNVNCGISGTVSETISIANPGAGISPGDSVAITYNECSFVAGEIFNGSETITYTVFDATGGNIAFTVVATNITLIAPGFTYGPFSYTASFSEVNGVVSWSYTVNGTSVVGEPVVSTSGSTTTIGSGSVNVNYAGGWVNISFSNWSYNPVTGLPTGGTCTITGSDGYSAVITVTSTGYNVVLKGPGGSLTYTIPF